MSSSTSPSLDTGLGLSVRDLTKSFGGRRVLEGIDVDFAPGTVTALLGPNGAGKTTLLKCLLGLVRPDAGSIAVGGAELDDGGDSRRVIGYMPQLPHFPPHMSTRQLAAMLDDLRDFNGDPDDELAEAFGLHSDWDQPFRSLSGGTRQKVNAALAFRYRAPVLILDEPTAGLEPAASLALKEKIRACRSEGRTVVVTSHNLGDLDAMADEVVFLLGGRVRFDGTLGALLDETGQPTLEEAIASITTGASASALRAHPDAEAGLWPRSRGYMEIVR
jgi:Cu-processing system ATP-binding protein